MGIFDSSAADPVQRLLKALGRFQRELARAEDGAERSVWFPPAREQVQHAEDIAVHEHWEELSRALGELVLIMEAFDGIGIIDQDLPHLKEAYKLLCQMAGDRIVGNIRPDLSRRWDRLYVGAAERLANADVELPERPDCFISNDSVTRHPLSVLGSIWRRIFGKG